MGITWRWIIPCIILLCLHAGICKAQVQAADTLEDHVKNSLSVYYKKYPREKIFVQTNQSVYAGGQTIWYKLYTQAYGKPSAISKIVYVQLAGVNGRLLIQNKLPVKNGAAHGNIDLPDSLKTGWYQLRAFTAWMMNFDESDYYYQNIYIQNTADTIHQPVIDKLPGKYQVDFFPEGGDIVDGTYCKVAFKVTDNDGRPVKIYGDVFDNNKQPVAKLVTVHDGMGIFSLEPTGNNYTALVHFPDKTIQRIALPAVKKEGVVMQVNQTSPTLVQLKVAYNGPAEKYKNLLLAAIQNNGKLATYPLELGRGTNVFSINKDGFSTGVLRLTLFDHSGLPVAERLVFVNNNDFLNLKLNADTLLANPHQQQVFSLNVTDASHKPMAGNFSVSVTDADVKADNSGENIYSSFLLTSELKGHVNNPAWYFKNSSDSLQQQLDMVMLTNGWRHFRWDRVLNTDRQKLQYPVETTQFIAGKIAGYQKPAEGKQVTIKLLIINQDSSKFIGYVTPDSTGSFILNDYNHSGVSTLFMETTDSKNHIKKLKISLFNSLGDSLQYIKYPPINISNYQPVQISPFFLSAAMAEKQAALQLRGVLLKTINIKGEKISPTQQVIKAHVTPLYTSINEYTLDLVNNFTLNMSLVEYISGKFPGLRIDQEGGDTYFYYLTSGTLQRPKANNLQAGMGVDSNSRLAKPYFFLNETLVQFEDVEYINLYDVALIRFLPPPVVFAPYNGGNVGAILIYTKNNIDERHDIISREQFDSYTFNGYAITREFSAPDYSNNLRQPHDNRITLYWNHDMNTDEQGIVRFRFYNSDKAKKYHIVIQGMDKDGRMGVFDGIF